MFSKALEFGIDIEEGMVVLRRDISKQEKVFAELMVSLSRFRLFGKLVRP